MSEGQELGGRRILVTGGTGGIGVAIVRSLAERGACVVVLARNSERAEQLIATLPESDHRAIAIDVGSERAWRSVAASGALAGVDGVVTAAGVLAPVGPIEEYSPRQFSQTMRVNVLGTLLAVKSCLSSLEAARGAVVTLAGAGGTSPRPRFDAYAASKAAVVRLSENLGLELVGRGVRVNSISPGFVASAMHEATLSAGPERAGRGYFEETRQQLSEGGAPTRKAAELTAFLLGRAAHGITGKLISAQWDPWRELAFQQRLRTEPDFATLRRIDGAFFDSR